MTVTPVKREHARVGTIKASSFNDEYYGRRIQMLRNAGANRLFDASPETLMSVVMSNLSDEDMLNNVIGAVDQVEFNRIKQQFQGMPRQRQSAEFMQLPDKMQRMLRGVGYEPPSEKDPDGLLRRIFTWDNPLLPEEFLRDKGVIADSFVGTAFKGLLAPVSALGFVLGTTASTLWEGGVMKPSRFATRFGRSLAYMAEQSSNKFSNPVTLREAWRESELEEGSWYESTTRAAEKIVGGAQADMIKLFVRDGLQGVYDHFETIGREQRWSAKRIDDTYLDWYDSLADPDNVEALEILESGRLTLPDASVRAWNATLPFDVRPGTKPATVIGVGGSLVTEILLDPTTYAGGFILKIAKPLRAGLRAGQSIDAVYLWRRIALAEREAESGILMVPDGVTGKPISAVSQVENASSMRAREWLKNGGEQVVAMTNMRIRSRARAINKFIDRINAAFKEVDAVDAFKKQLLQDSPGLTASELAVEVSKEFGSVNQLELLLRDVPALNLTTDEMLAWHRARRDGHWFTEIDGELVHRIPESGDIGIEELTKIRGSVPTLADEQGYWDFLQDNAGKSALSTRLGGVDPEAILIPKIGKFASGWMTGKRYMRSVLDFDKFPVEVRADMARMTAQYLAKQTDYVRAKLWDDIQSGALKLSNDIDQDALNRFIDDPLIDMADDFGLTPNDVLRIEESRNLYQRNAAQVILEDSELSDLLHWYQANGYEIRGSKLVLKDKDWFQPFSGARKAATSYYREKIPSPGGLNAELSWAEEAKIIGKSAARAAAYYPARFAEKLTTYVPTSSILDVTDVDSAIKEFTSLVDMGVMSGMSRTQIDGYLRSFVLGNESQRWLVQNEFFLDFIGRSGVLVHGGRDVQEFIEKFIRYGHQRYANIADAPVGLHGLNIHRAVVPGVQHSAQLATANVIPNYKQLAAITRYMGFYRWAGWGMHLPAIDKFLARTWRPAVLLRLGYVARNGGEELFSWWLREGPRHWAHQKLARASIGKHTVWDEYGRKLRTTLAPEEQLPLIWRPFSRLWRSFNEVAGVGDYAITRKALIESVENNPKWKYVSDDQRTALFNATRTQVKSDVESSIIGGLSRQMFELAEVEARRLSALIHNTSQALGIHTKQSIASYIGRKVDSRHNDRVHAMAIALTDPTVLDAQMKGILGTFDNYLNPGADVDSVLRAGGFNSPQVGLQLPMNYGQSKNKWISNASGSELYAIDKSIAVTQRLSYMADDPAHIAFLKELSHYASPQQEAVFADLGRSLGITVRDGQSWSAEMHRWFKANHSDALSQLEDAFDAGDILRLTEVADVDDVIKQITAIEEFVEAMPSEIQDQIRKFLEPVVGTGQNPNHIAFLLSEIDPKQITLDYTTAQTRGKRAFVNYLMTPEGQDMLRSTHRSHIGFTALGGAISEPLPPGATRLFVPMIPREYTEALTSVLASGRGGEWFDSFVDSLTTKFVRIGLTKTDARKTALLLQPGMGPETLHHTPNIYNALAGEWAGSSHLPILTVSSNDATASAIAESLEELLAPMVNIPRIRRGGRIGSLDINSEELFNTPGAASGGRTGGGPDIPIMRGGVTTTFRHKDLSPPSDADYMNSYYGWTTAGAAAARDFGAQGLKNEAVFGIAATKLFPYADDGLKPVQMINGKPVTHRVKVFRHREDGRTAVLRASDERSAAWYKQDEWNLIDTQIVTHNDLRNAAEELALINAVEIEDLLTTGVRTLPGQRNEVFHPWIRETLRAGTSDNGISQNRINKHAATAAWWDKAPERILMLAPVTDEGGTTLEKIDKAWGTLLRNWFDGVVNPMIGAMVREPLFQHYFLTALDQTAVVRRAYFHEDDAYRALRKAVPFQYDSDGQVTFKALKGFIELDWQHARMAPDSAIAKVAFAIESKNPKTFAASVKTMLKDEAAGLAPETGKLFKSLARLADADDDLPIRQFFSWALRSKAQFEAHRSVALRRAMTLTGAFIDDHRIRSQFQAMVGTILPFWFAEDQFLRRMGRSINHNPLMMRNLHLTMNAGVHGGLVQEDQFGEKRLVIPGSEVATTYMLEIAEDFPIVNSVFGGALGSVARATVKSGISTNINVIPGYDLDQVGQAGFGPLLAVQLNLLSHRDPSIRQDFERNLVGGRYSGASKLIENSGDVSQLLGETIWSSVVPAVIARPLAVMGFDGGAGRSKAAKDILSFMAINNMLPDEREIASAENPLLFKEEFLDRVDEMAKQYQLLQALTWFIGPATGQLSDLMLNENWEWNDEFHALTDQGIPWEDAYQVWMKNIEAREGEFDPLQFSPFRTSTSTKIPLAVLESTQDANVWLTSNEEFVRSFKMASAFFMPRKFDSEDTEYVAEAKQRQINMGLRSHDTPAEFMEELYYNAAFPAYHKIRTSYMTQKYAMRNFGQDTKQIDLQWRTFFDSFQERHPVFAHRITTGTSEERRNETIDEFRLLVNNQALVPQGEHREELIAVAATIVEFHDALNALSGRQTASATDKRNALKYKYWRLMAAAVEGRPWLNEMYYSVFLPLVSDSWLAKYEAGLIDVTSGL